MNPGQTKRVSLSVPSELRFGEAARAMLDALTKRIEHETNTPDLNVHVISAFGEAFNNIVDHAYRGDQTGVVDIEFAVSPQCLSITLADRGVGFDIDSVEKPNLESLPERGLGLVIIQSVMSRVDYRRIGDRNTLTMEKDFARPLQIGAQVSSVNSSREED